MTVAEDYKLVEGCEISGTFDRGVKIFVKVEHDLTEDERDVLYKSREAILSILEKESLRLDPQTHINAAAERAEIVALFPPPGYVEEIPNGYCSRSCCAFKPWFVVTTSAGRIKIGWRKSVIHLEWTDSDIRKTAEEIFPNEEAWPGYQTTQYDRIIHAHGYEAARKYILRILDAPR